MQMSQAKTKLLDDIHNRLGVSVGGNSAKLKGHTTFDYLCGAKPRLYLIDFCHVWVVFWKVSPARIRYIIWL